MDLSDVEHGLEEWRTEIIRAIRSGKTIGEDQENRQRNPMAE